MSKNLLNPELPLIQDADLNGKTVLIRVDHNVVKKGKIKDPYRIDCSIKTLTSILEKGGRPILMTHVGRPKDKKTGTIKCISEESVGPIVQYLEKKLQLKLRVPAFPIDPEKGILGIDDSIKPVLQQLKEKKIDGIYLPNTRWFRGEEEKGELKDKFARELSGLADIFVNDAFGSWQAHASTYDVTKHLPSYAGFLMQQELINLGKVLNPEKPFVAAVAGAKYDTKIKPLYAIYEKVHKLILGGVVYNTYLCAKYDVKIAGVSESDIELAKELVEKDKGHRKIVELRYLVESDTMEGRVEGKYRTISTSDFKPGKSFGYVLDVGPKSFEEEDVTEAIGKAKTIFVNAVMGFTPHFGEGSQKFYNQMDLNKKAMKMYGGGDTLEELKNLCPDVYSAALDDDQYYFFTGGGTILTAIEQGTPYGLKPVQGLIESTK
jgi:phosphoglycerate kinase